MITHNILEDNFWNRILFRVQPNLDLNDVENLCLTIEIKKKEILNSLISQKLNMIATKRIWWHSAYNLLAFTNLCTSVHLCNSIWNQLLRLNRHNFKLINILRLSFHLTWINGPLYDDSRNIQNDDFIANTQKKLFWNSVRRSARTS